MMKSLFLKVILIFVFLSINLNAIVKKEYDENGNLIKVIPYNKNGNIHGKVLEYSFQINKITKTIDYINGIKDGMEYEYDSNIKIIEYVPKNKEDKKYFGNKSKYVSRPYKNGKIHGFVIFKYEEKAKVAAKAMETQNRQDINV